MNDSRNPHVRTQGGIVSIPQTIDPANASLPRVFTPWFYWDSDKPQPVELSVDISWPDASAAQSFPDSTFTKGGEAGAWVAGTPPSNWTGGDSSMLVARFECGNGNNIRTIYTDVVPGRFSLGVQTSVRASVCRWRANAPYSSPLVLQGSLAPVHGRSWADPPKYTASVILAPADIATLNVPPGAIWWDASLLTGPSGSGSTVVIEAGQEIYLDSTLNAQVKTLGAPWPVTTSSIAAENTGANSNTLNVTFWIT